MTVPHPPIESDNDWVERVAARVLAEDPRLVEAEVFDIVANLCKYPDWRALPPHEAAARVFAPPESAASP